MESKNLFEESLKDIKAVSEEIDKEKLYDTESFIIKRTLESVEEILNNPSITELSDKLAEKLGSELTKELFETIAIAISKVSAESMAIVINSIPKAINAVNNLEFENMNDTVFKDINKKFTDQEGMIKVLGKRIELLESNLYYKYNN